MQQIMLRLRVMHVFKRITGDREQAELRVVLEGVRVDVLQTIRVKFTANRYVMQLKAVRSSSTMRVSTMVMDSTC